MQRFRSLTLSVNIQIYEMSKRERDHGQREIRTKNAINLEIRLPDSVLRFLSSNFTLNSINWTKFIRIILHCIFWAAMPPSTKAPNFNRTRSITRETHRAKPWRKKLARIKQHKNKKNEMSFVRLQTAHIKICVPLHIPFERIHRPHTLGHTLVQCNKKRKTVPFFATGFKTQHKLINIFKYFPT